MISNWEKTLRQLDTDTNHLETLKTVEEAFITSDYANCKDSRTNVFLLIRHFKKLFSTVKAT